MKSNENSKEKNKVPKVILALSAIIFLVIALDFGLFWRMESNPPSQHQENDQSQHLSTIPLKISTSTGTYDFVVEVAKTQAEKGKGLMFRRNLAENEGMLFVFDKSSIQNFWMKDTYLSLDIIFLDDQKKVVNFSQSTVPLQTYPTYGSVGLSKYVLEAPSGTVNRIGLRTNDQFFFEED